MDGQDARDERAGGYRAAADRIAVLARRLGQEVDLLTGEQLAEVLIGIGWVAEASNPRRKFTADGFTARVLTGGTTATVAVDLANFGCPRELDPDDFDDEATYDAARDRPYHDADAAVQNIADWLDLDPADPLAVDERADYGCRVLLRAGHWVVTVAAVQPDPEFSVVVEASLTYGADLPGRLAQLAGPAPRRGPADWSVATARIGAELPDDYRWLMEHYGPGTFGDYLTLTPPSALSEPVPGPLVGVLRYQTATTLPVATRADGAVVSLVMDPPWNSNQWGLRITSPDTTPWDVSTGLLYFLVVTLFGAYTVPQFQAAFPSMAPRFVPTTTTA